MTLYERMAQMEMLHGAWEKVADNDGCAGWDGVAPEDFGDVLEIELSRLHKELTARQYKPGPS